MKSIFTSKYVRWSSPRWHYHVWAGSIGEIVPTRRILPWKTSRVLLLCFVSDGAGGPITAMFLFLILSFSHFLIISDFLRVSITHASAKASTCDSSGVEVMSDGNYLVSGDPPAANSKLKNPVNYNLRMQSVRTSCVCQGKTRRMTWLYNTISRWDEMEKCMPQTKQIISNIS